MADEILTGVVRHDALVALHAHEADVVENVFEGVVTLGKRAESLVKHTTVGLRSVAQLVLEVDPAGAFGDKESVVEVRVLAVFGLGFFLNHSLLDFATNDLLPLSVEDIRAALQEKHPEDVVLVGRSIEPFLTQPVSGLV